MTTDQDRAAGRPEIQEPNWLEYSSAEFPDFEIETDLNSSPMRWRHRRRVNSGEELQPWRDGFPPHGGQR